jgi:hypothetical protein
MPIMKPYNRLRGPTRREVLCTFGGWAAALSLGCARTGRVDDDQPSKANADRLALRFAHYYQPVAVDVKPRVTAYTLPLDLTKVANFKHAADALGLTADEPSLKKNGFAVLPGKGNEDIVGPYKEMVNLGIPLFITADTLLHLYHVQFDETLKNIEERQFYPDIVALTKTLIKELATARLPADTEDFRAARSKALTYFAVALKALDPQAEVPEGVAARDVEEVLEQMRKHEGFWPDPDARPCPWGLFRYSEDFSQYVPRGHYTRSAILKRYFVGLMWLGRMTFLIKGDPDFSPRGGALVSVEESNRQTLAASLVTSALHRVSLADSRKAWDVWERIYSVTSFYVGLADDLGPPEYKAALAKVCGAALDLAVLADDKKILELKVDLARLRKPAIYGGTGAMEAQPEGPGELLKALDKSMGFRFMGQRFVPDSYMLGKLVYPSVGPPTREGIFTLVPSGIGPIRGFPRGLDVMAVLGCTTARDVLRELGDDAYRAAGKTPSYDDTLAALRKEYAALGEADWNRNLYWSWLYVLRPLLAEYGEGYPTFMTTLAYRRKSLTTALASWAQLRHDTILYVKQSYTPVAPTGFPQRPPPVQGYVEPLPEFYARLLALTRMTRRGLGEMKVLDDAAKGRLDALDKILDRLLVLSRKELAEEKLTEDDHEYIRNFASNLEALVVPAERGQDVAPVMKTTLVADVHTDSNSQKVLEEATGYVDLGVFVYRQPDGRLLLGAGPVLSYYEFKHPMRDRLTNEKWRELLKGKEAPARPEWTRDYLTRTATWPRAPERIRKED